jgi:hypothetical protein
MSLTQLRNLGIVANAGISTTKLGTGAIRQVSSVATTSGTQSIATTTYTDVTSLSLSITPSSASSKILLISNINVSLGSDRGIGLRFLKDATNIYTTTQQYALYSQSTTIYLTSPFVYLDSPSTTSAITYKVQCASYVSGAVTLNVSMESTFYLMEIAG